MAVEERNELVFLEEEMKKSYLSYAMSVIVGRALPDARDGLKPVQRRILYAMRELGLLPNRPYRKSARLVGEVLGKYHPHGDMAVYDALVRMAQDFSLRHPLVDGQGNFGSIDGDPPAAMRYTEVRLAPISEELLNDLDKDTVDFTPNFDNSLKEPVVLPAAFPNLLVNGASGIAVGMATNIPPHNLGEIIDACIAMIENPQITLEELLNFVKGPDFPTGGIILQSEGIKKAYEEGKGKIIVRGKARIEREGGRERIIIEEIPYQVIKTNLIEKIAELAQSEKIKGIKSIRDESDKRGIRVVIEVSRAFTSEIILNQLYKHTPLQVTFGIILLALVDGKPQQLSLTQAIRYYLDHRRNVVIRRTKYLLDKEEKKAHILEGFKKALNRLDEVVKTIRESSNPEEAEKNLIERFDLTKTQANSILNMRLQRLTSIERDKIEKDYTQAVENIKEFRAILKSDERIWGIIKEELGRIKEKYATPRKTLIEEEITAQELLNFKPEDLIEKEDVVITITSNGYIKYTPLRAYKRQKRGGKGASGISLRRGDAAENILLCNTHSTLLFFTSSGKVHSIKAYEIPQKGRGEKGRSIMNFIPLEKEENISAVIPVESFASHNFLFMVTKKGIVKKTLIKEYSHIKRGGIIAIKIHTEDELMKVLITSGDDDIILCTKRGMAIRFSEKDVRPMGRVSAGVKGINLSRGDEVVDACIVDENADLLTITAKGYGKRTPFSSYRKIKRGGKGIKNIKLASERGEVVATKKVSKDDEVIIITQKGKSIRLWAKNIRQTNRVAAGCRIIKLDEDDRVIALT
ncbi:DNA gyrase subunit A [Candidatus Aerophobetes bacterium]|nr:DNA gyrase subunit A [Candidatus Aerophobetes bacterium]